ncbi:hypothetical protein [Aeromonas hydrophila]|uniref:hypothetical protein n=1 Tax=Aeromonas hydrophila TaxID=644 RepID=UPI003EC82D35
MLDYLKLLLLMLVTVMPAMATNSYSDDTELFVYDFSKAGDFRPKILIVFDNSGSMSETMDVVKEEYNPSTIYAALNKDPDTGNSKNIYIIQQMVACRPLLVPNVFRIKLMHVPLQKHH